MKIKFSFIIFLFLFSSCYEDNKTTTEIIVDPEPSILVEASEMVVTLKDENGRLLPHVPISIDGTETVSDAPFHYVEASEIHKYNELATIYHPTGMLMYYPLSNIENTLNIHDIPILTEFKTLTFSNDEAQEMLVEADLSIDFQKGVLQRNLEPLTETYEINAKRIDLDNEHKSATIPNRLAYNETTESQYLSISQAFYLGIEGVANQDIYFSADKLTFKTMAEGDLYFFDAVSRAWTKHQQDASYETGFYAIGTLLPITKAKLEINPSISLNGCHVEVFVDNRLIKSQPLNKKNACTLLLPSEEEILLKLYSGSDLISTTTLQSVDVMTWDIDIDPSNVGQISIDSRDCDDQKVDQVFLVRGKDENTMIFPAIQNIRISYYYTNSNDAAYQTYNTKFESYSEQISLPNSDQVQLGRQYLCSDVSDNYLVFYAEGNLRLLTNIQFEENNGEGIITGVDNESGAEFKLKFDNQSIGNVMDSDINVLLNDPELNGGYALHCFDSNTGCGFEKFEFTNNQLTPTTYIKGIFSGTFWIESITSNDVGYRKLHGEFQVKR